MRRFTMGREATGNGAMCNGAMGNGVMAPLAVRVGKRTADVAASVLLLALLAPLLLLIGVAIRIDSPGPALFRQMRVGRASARRTELFEMVKFRTMRVDADRSGAVWATARDPRITRVGAFLRKTRLDELPQLWNVLRGEMSLIGPRPEQLGIFGRLERSVPFYSERIWGVRPGITGWAQIEVGYDTCVNDVRRKILYDFGYALGLSGVGSWLRMDAAILWGTVLAVLRREGV